MRLIKFRGKTILNPEWVYGDLLNFGNNVLSIGSYTPIGYEMKRRIDSDTIGQFTGLQDANGTDVYEGDIVRYQRNNKTYQVVFKDGIFWGEGNNGCGCAAHFFPACEIVGNVFDNLDLLK